MIYKLNKKLYVFASLISLSIVTLSMMLKLLLRVEYLHISGELYFLLFYLFLYPFMYLFCRRMMQSHKYAKINALWFVPIINIVYALIFGLAISSNFWSANFSMLLVGVGNSIAFAIYYIRQRYRKRKFNNQLEFEFQRSKVVKIKPFIMIGTISFLSIVTVIINMVVKSNFGLEFTPYILSDIIFLIGIVGVYCAVLVLYYFKYDASIKSLALGAIISFSYSNIIFAVFAPMLSLHEQLDIVSIEIWHLYAVNIALIIVNVISITIYHLWNYHSKKGLSKADEIY